MKTICKLGLALLLGLCAATPALAENTVAVNEVVKLKTAGLTDDTVTAYIRSKNYYYDLSSDSILRLKDQGISQPIINAMLLSGSAPTVPSAPAVDAAPVPAAAVPVAQPVAVPVAQPVVTGDAAYYYQELTPYGRWILLEDGTWSWQPRIILTTPEWRPYWDEGHWVWTDQGWYWASDYPWGGVAFHYGRWHLHPGYGWVWVPDRVWGPAWVVWRNSGDYCGWAPLPPGAYFDVAGGFFTFRGHRVEAGFDFGLGLNHFSFCFGRELGEPFHRHFRPTPEFRTVFIHSAIVHNYSVERGPGGNRIINRGIEPSRIHDARPDAFRQVRVRDIRGPGNPGPAAVNRAPAHSEAPAVPSPVRGGDGRGFNGPRGNDHPGFGGGR